MLLRTIVIKIKTCGAFEIVGAVFHIKKRERKKNSFKP